MAAELEPTGEEQARIDAVRRVLGGESVAVVAADLGRTSRWVRKWVARYDPDSDSWFVSQSRRPHTTPARTSDDVEQLIVATRKRLAAHSWTQVGSSAIAWELEKLGVDTVPSLRTIERVLARHQVERRRRRGNRYIPKGTPYPAPETDAPNTVQQADLVGPRYLHGGTQFYVVNAIDVIRRKIAGEIVTSRSADALCGAIYRIWERLGTPVRLQLDNQQALAGANRRPGKLTRLCATHGVTPLFIPYREPWRNGIIEQYHNTFDKKFYRTETFTSIDHVTDRYRQFEAFHNSRHRYSALGGATPNQIETRTGFTPTPPEPGIAIPDTFTDLTGTIEWIRLIRSDQQLPILRHRYPMPENLIYEYVTARLDITHQHLTVYHHNQPVTDFPYPLDPPHTTT